MEAASIPTWQGQWQGDRFHVWYPAGMGICLCRKEWRIDGKKKFKQFWPSGLSSLCTHSFRATNGTYINLFSSMELEIQRLRWNSVLEIASSPPLFLLSSPQKSSCLALPVLKNPSEPGSSLPLSQLVSFSSSWPREDFI